MSKERIRTLTVRSFFLLSCYRSYLIKGHKDYEQSLIITVENSGGNLSFSLIDLSTNEVTELDNPESGVYELPLSKGVNYQFVITAKAAKGKYKIQKKTIIE